MFNTFLYFLYYPKILSTEMHDLTMVHFNKYVIPFFGDMSHILVKWMKRSISKEGHESHHARESRSKYLKKRV
ncbi:hypothetical protein B5V89_11265 [Heyndrickxia sporothermodurans]|nr:hypothetical protein B5V89_11265 [Heyndrickxia sporothermodurans]